MLISNRHSPSRYRATSQVLRSAAMLRSRSRSKAKTSSTRAARPFLKIIIFGGCAPLSDPRYSDVAKPSIPYFRMKGPTQSISQSIQQAKIPKDSTMSSISRIRSRSTSVSRKRNSSSISMISSRRIPSRYHLKKQNKISSSTPDRHDFHLDTRFQRRIGIMAMVLQIPTKVVL